MQATQQSPTESQQRAGGRIVNPPQKRRYRILQGRHVETVPTGRFKQVQGDKVEIMEDRWYIAGTPEDVITTDFNLVAEFNRRGYPQKFQELNERDVQQPSGYVRGSAESLDQFIERVRQMEAGQAGVLPPQRKPLDQLSDVELSDLADEHEIDFGKIKDRAGRIKALQAAGL